MNPSLAKLVVNRDVIDLINKKHLAGILAPDALALFANILVLLKSSPENFVKLGLEID